MGNLLLKLLLVNSKFLQGLWNVQLYVEFIDLLPQTVDQCLLGSPRKSHPARDLRVTGSGNGILCIICDNIRKINCICASVRNMSCGECGAGLMGHGMYDSQKCIGECHSRKALGIMHLLSCFHIAVIGGRKVIQNHLDGLKSQRIGKGAVKCGNVSLDGVGQRIHSRICHLLYRQSGYQIRIHDGHIRRNIKVSQRVFHTSLIVCNNGKCGYLRSCSRGGRNRSKLRLLS